MPTTVNILGVPAVDEEMVSGFPLILLPRIKIILSVNAAKPFVNRALHPHNNRR
jgi:hypothetical protein